MSFERRVTFEPAYDKRHKDPTKNYGIHGVTLRMGLIGAEGAVSFALYTNWQLPHVQVETDARILQKSHLGSLDEIDLNVSYHSMPADLGYHALQPRYEGQTKMDKCDLLGQPCYYDGSTLNAEPVFERLLREGDKGVWTALEEYYAEVFGEAK